MNFITPEHITIAMLSVGDVGARQVVHKCAGCTDSVPPISPAILLATSAPSTAGSQGHAQLCHVCTSLRQSFGPCLRAQHTAIEPAGWEWTRRPSRRRPSSASSGSRRARARPSAGRKW